MPLAERSKFQLRLDNGDAMKKKIVIGIFIALILLTVVSFFVLIISCYNQDLENDDHLAALGAIMALFLCGCFVFYECDLFYTVYYFVVSPKTALKSTLHILSHLSLVLLGVSLELPGIIFNLPDSMKINTEWVAPILFLSYAILRSACIYAYAEDPAPIPES